MNLVGVKPEAQVILPLTSFFFGVQWLSCSLWKEAMQLWVASCDAPPDWGRQRDSTSEVWPPPALAHFHGCVISVVSNYVQKPDQSLLQMESNGKITAKADNQGCVKQKCLCIILGVPRLVCALPSSLLSS